MLTKIINFSINNKLIIGLFTLALIGFGIYNLTKLPIDAVPDITDNQVQVITVAPSFGATDIERLVTFPIEQANANIAGIKEIRSFSRFGLSLVTIVFNDAVDLYWARQQVAERLQKVQTEIPKGIGIPELGPITTGLGEIYQYVLRPKKGYENKYDETELRTMQDWIVRRQLLGVNGVAEVSSFGGKLKQYNVEIDPNKLLAYKVTVNDVFKALENNNQNTGGAYIEKGPTVLYIRSEGLIGNIEDIKNIALPIANGASPLFIRDVADIKIGNATRYGAMCFNDRSEVAGAIVMMLKGANSSDVIKNVKERISQIQKTLPEGVLIEPFLDRTKMVNNAIGTVEKNLLEGALIVIFVLVVFLGNFRAGILVASVIPLAMLFAIIMMNVFGVSGNLMSLGALDFGLIVDGAVIIVEAVMHKLMHNDTFKKNALLNQAEMDTSVKDAASKMMNSAVFGQVIILVVYLPIFTLQGIEGKMFKPMAQTVAFALLGAFILSLTYIPMMCSVFLSKKTKHTLNISDKLMAKIVTAYTKILHFILANSRKVLLATLLLFCGALYTFSTLGGEFIPTLEEGDFAVDTRVLTGSNLTTTITHTQKAAHILKSQFPEVEKVVTKIGSGEVPTDPMPMEASDMMVILKDKKDWTSAKTFDELSEKMSTALADLPGVTFGFQYPVQMRFNELMTGARQDVVCKIFGENLDTLAHYAARLGNIVNTVNGAKNLYVEAVSGLPQIVINYNRSAIAQYNIDIASINQTVNTALAGQSSGMVFEGEKRFDLVVKLNGALKKDIADIKNLLIPTLNGLQIPLAQLAEVAIIDGPNQIQREDAKRRIIVGFNTSGRDVQSIVKELQEKTNAQIKFPPGYYITYGGAFENLTAAKKRLMIAVPISLLLIFILLFFAFNSVKHALLIYSAIPLSAIGGVLFLALRGMPFSISAGIGFIALFGVAVLNGIVLVTEFNRLKKEKLLPLKDIVINGSQLRLRPVLMTAFVASLGFLPMALSNGSGAEVQRPLATVVIGGLLVATFLTLFVLPILYMAFEGGLPKKQNKRKMNKIIPFLLLAFSNSFNTFAQQPITVENAIEIAFKNSLKIKNDKIKAIYTDKLIATAKNTAPTNITLDAGQLNSIYFDTRLNVQQTFNMPTVYKRQKELLQQEAKASLLLVNLTEYELRYEVSVCYNKLIYLQNKVDLLHYVDSLYLTYLKRAEIRFKNGEANVLEKTMLESNRNNIGLQLMLINNDLALEQLQWQWLLNAEASYMPIYTKQPLTFIGYADSLMLKQHPILKLLAHNLQIIDAQTKVEQSKLLPQIIVGVNNGSIRGVGADNKTYRGINRFTALQAGVAIPLFNKGQKAKIEATKYQTILAHENFNLQEQQLLAAFKKDYLNYTQLVAVAKYIENNNLKTSNTIIKTATAQYNNGAINYLEWGQLVQKAIETQSEYLDAINNINIAVIALNKISNK